MANYKRKYLQSIRKGIDNIKNKVSIIIRIYKEPLTFLTLMLVLLTIILLLITIFLPEVRVLIGVEKYPSTPSGSLVDEKNIILLPVKRDNEIRIIVTNLDANSTSDYSITKIVVETLQNNLQDYPNLKIYQLMNTSITIGEGSEEEINKIGKRENSNIIIWGWYNVLNANAYGLHIAINNENYQSTNKAVCPNTIENTQKPLSLINVSQISLNIQNAIPSEITSATYYLLGTIYYYSEEWNTSIEFFTKAIDSLNKGFTVDIKTNQNEHLIDRNTILYYLGMAYAKLDNISSAINYFEEIILTDPNNYLINLDLGIWYQNNSNYEESILHLENVLSHFKEPIANYYLGLSYQAIGQKALAKMNFDASLLPDEVYILDYILSDMYPITDSEIENTIKTFTGIIENNSNALAYAIRAQAYWYEADYDLSLIDYNKYLEIIPNSTLIRYYRSEVFYQLERFEDQIKDLNILINTKNGSLNPCYYHNRGEAFYSLGYKEKGKEDYLVAIKLLTDIISRDQNNVDAYCVRGYSYESIGNYIFSYLDFMKVKELDPDLVNNSEINSKIITFQFLTTIITMIVIVIIIIIILSIIIIFKRKSQYEKKKKKRKNKEKPIK